MTFYQSKSLNQYYKAINSDLKHYKAININSDLKLKKFASDINLYFFFDLYQVCQDILNITSEDDHIILIGNTPSYLKPILEKHRYTYNLPFSGYPLACFWLPYARPFSNEEIKYSYEVAPTKRQLHSYFNYLDSNTPLTRNFIIENWKKIVLVDSSQGPTIHGISVFFNRYVGNILEEQIGEDDLLDCTNINNSQPLRFILTTDERSICTNIYPEKAQLLFENIEESKIKNYNPELIIFQGDTVFSHIILFLVYEYFPRYIPSYKSFSWTQDPYKNSKPDNDFVEKIKQIYELFLIYEKNITDAKRLYKIIESLPYVSHDITLFNKNSDIIKNLKYLFTKINNRVLVNKQNKSRKFWLEIFV